MTIKIRNLIQSKYISVDFLFEFLTNERRYLCNSSGKKCPVCNCYEIDSSYIKIIRKLKGAGLVDKNYEELCCFCNKLRDLNMHNYIRNKDVDDIDWFCDDYGYVCICIDIKKQKGNPNSDSYGLIFHLPIEGEKIE